jgi:hypothetical protein
MKKEIIEIINKARLENTTKADVFAQELLDLFIVRLSLPDSEINQKAEDYADALNLTDALQREACTEDLKAAAKWRWEEILKVLNGNEA